MSCHKGLSLVFCISKAPNEASVAEGVLKIVSLTNIFLMLISLGDSIRMERDLKWQQWKWCTKVCSKSRKTINAYWALMTNIVFSKLISNTVFNEKQCSFTPTDSVILLKYRHEVSSLDAFEHLLTTFIAWFRKV